MDQATKICSRCKTPKPLAEYSKDARGAGGKRADCKACAKVRADLYTDTHRAQVLAAAKVYREAHEAEVRAYQKTYREAHLEEDRARSRMYAEAHSERARKRARDWQLANPDRLNAAHARRKAAKLKATPAWADPSAIAEVYEEARSLTEATGVEHHVDHIVPLKSKLVSGLHVEFNLQPLPKPENLKKSNRVWPDMP